MATGFYDARGIWQYGEDDPASPFSDLLNLLAESTSVEIANDRAQIGSLGDRIANVQYPPLYRAYKSEHTDVASGAWSGVGSMTVDFNSGAWPDAGHSSIREVPRPGVYRFTAVAWFRGSATQAPLYLTIRKNATDQADPQTGTTIANARGGTRGDSNDTMLMATCLAEFAVGDTFSLGVRQDTGTSLELVGNVTYSTSIEAEYRHPAL